jgi:RimJ/RimL family protein N-acetyltransferase
VTNEFTIRRARGDDASRIAGLIDGLERSVLVSEIDTLERAERLRALIDSGVNVHFIAEVGSEVVGELALARGEPGPASLGMGVVEEWRRRGIATALLSTAIDWAKANGLHKLTVDVFPHNEVAIDLLRKFGFAEEGRLRRHYRRADGDAWDIIVLSRLLDAPITAAPTDRL